MEIRQSGPDETVKERRGRKFVVRGRGQDWGWHQGVPLVSGLLKKFEVVCFRGQNNKIRNCGANKRKRECVCVREKKSSKNLPSA